MKDDRLYLIHVRECIERIEQYALGGKDAFFTDAKTQDAVLRVLQTLAESTQRISDALKASHSEGVQRARQRHHRKIPRRARAGAVQSSRCRRDINLHAAIN